MVTEPLEPAVMVPARALSVEARVIFPIEVSVVFPATPMAEPVGTDRLPPAKPAVLATRFPRMPPATAVPV